MEGRGTEGQGRAGQESAAQGKIKRGSGQGKAGLSKAVQCKEEWFKTRQHKMAGQEGQKMTAPGQDEAERGGGAQGKAYRIV